MTTKTITITLNKEQEELLLKKFDRATFRLSDKERTFLQRDRKGYKNPGKWTLDQVARAKGYEKLLEKEWEVSYSITDQIKKQLEEA